MKTVDVNSLSDTEYQTHILQGVARTFALTIPQLPKPLVSIVSNAYLLCRITDTIEDNEGLTAEQKHLYAKQFVSVLLGNASAEDFSEALLPLLAEQTLDAEKDLIRNTKRVIAVSHSFTPAQRAALERCVSTMAAGMAYYQSNTSLAGLKDINQFNSYCYYVAGVVGELLTELYSLYSADIEKQKGYLMPLGVSFGQGLQMTNILKDMWEDRQRGVSWLPQTVFQEQGIILSDLEQFEDLAVFAQVVSGLVAIAHGHLSNALLYTLSVPKKEQGLRKFCTWAMIMALLTLRKIEKNPGFKSGQEVKISKRSVIIVVLLSNIAVKSNILLRILFKLAALGLPRPCSSSVASASNHVREWFNA